MSSLYETFKSEIDFISSVSIFAVLLLLHNGIPILNIIYGFVWIILYILFFLFLAFLTWMLGEAYAKTTEFIDKIMLKFKNEKND